MSCYFDGVDAQLAYSCTCALGQWRRVLPARPIVVACGSWHNSSASRPLVEGSLPLADGILLCIFDALWAVTDRVEAL